MRALLQDPAAAMDLGALTLDYNFNAFPPDFLPPTYFGNTSGPTIIAPGVSSCSMPNSWAEESTLRYLWMVRSDIVPAI